MATALVVDDSALIRRALRAILERSGHAVRDAADGQAALDRYGEARPDIVFLDITMPGMDGLETLSRLISKDPDAVAVVVTADLQEATRRLVSARGARGVVTKPFVPADVLGAMDTALAPAPAAH